MKHGETSNNQNDHNQAEKKEKVFRTRSNHLKNFRGKMKEARELEIKNKQLETQISQLNDKYLRTLAEFDNYRKRTGKEKQELLKYGIENYVLQLLPFDEIFERVLQQIEDQMSESDSIYKGLEMLRKEFINLLKSLGVEKIKTLNAKFDPAVHEAAGTVVTEKVPDGQIVEEERSGYLLHDKVLRPAVVKVAKKSGEKNENEDIGSGEDQSLS